MAGSSWLGCRDFSATVGSGSWKQQAAPNVVGGDGTDSSTSVVRKLSFKRDELIFMARVAVNEK